MPEDLSVDWFGAWAATWVRNTAEEPLVFVFTAQSDKLKFF